MKHFAIDGKHSMIDLLALNCPHFFLANPPARPDPQSQPSLTLCTSAHLLSYALFFGGQASKLAKALDFWFAEVPARLACTELSELLMTV